MDCADSLLVDHSGTLTPATTFLRLLGLVKGLRPEIVMLIDTSISPAIEHRGIQIQGFWPAVHYLSELRPYPDLMPSSPARRGVVASLTELVLTDASYLSKLEPLYKAGPSRPSQVTLLDIAVASYCDTPLEIPFPWVIPVGEALGAFIFSLQEDHL